MTIKPNSVVALTYELHTTENGEKVFVEKATEENPLVFLYGLGMMLPKFEEYLNAISHGIGAFLGLIGLALLISYDTSKTAWSLFSVIV